MPAVQEKVNIYEEAEKEIIIFDDAIQVKQQKAMRETKHKKLLNEAEEKTKNKVSTDVVMLEKKEGGFKYIIGEIDEKGNEAKPGLGLRFGHLGKLIVSTFYKKSYYFSMLHDMDKVLIKKVAETKINAEQLRTLMSEERWLWK